MGYLAAMRTFTIPQRYPGKLAIAARPRGNEWLETDLLLFKRAGWNVLVSALEISEERELGLDREAQMLEELGLEHISFPIPDRGTPGVVRTMELVRSLEPMLMSGRNVAVHCRAGIGRSSLLCSAIIVHAGADPEEVWRTLSEARGTTVPDTDEQRRWLTVFERALRR